MLKFYFQRWVLCFCTIFLWITSSCNNFHVVTYTSLTGWRVKISFLFHYHFFCCPLMLLTEFFFSSSLLKCINITQIFILLSKFGNLYSFSVFILINSDSFPTLRFFKLIISGCSIPFGPLPCHPFWSRLFSFLVWCRMARYRLYLLSNQHFCLKKHLSLFDPEEG